MGPHHSLKRPLQSRRPDQDAPTFDITGVTPARRVWGFQLFPHLRS